MFRHVIVGVDGRPTGRDAVALARLLVGPAGRLTLTHVHAGELLPGRGSSLAFDAAERDDSRRMLEREREATSVDAELALRPRSVVACITSPRSKTPTS
jgi:hypothetical protein